MSDYFKIEPREYKYQIQLGFSERIGSANWLNEHCEGKYFVGIWHVEFELETDMILFKLRGS